MLRRPRLLFSPVYLQAIGIIQAPDVLADGRMDMCDGCPDMCVNEGTLVHSCRWDEWRLYGGYMQARPQAADVSNEERIPEQAEESEDVAMPV
mgnify:FL=1